MSEVAEMIEDFGEDVTIRRYVDGGTHIGGTFVDRGFNEFTMRASVQPMTGNVATEEGFLRRTQGEIKIYTSDELMSTNADKKIKADQVHYKGALYEVQQVERWTQLDIQHYKSIARRLSQGATQ